MISSRKKIRPYILLLPVLILILGIFISGIISGLLISLGYFPEIGLNTMTLQYYKEILSNPSFYRSFGFSFYTSFISSSIAVILGVLLSYLLIFNRKKKPGRLANVYKAPIIVPHTIAALLIFILFTQSGWIARLLFQLGLIKNMTDFSPMIFDQNGIGIIFAYVWKGLPFITLITCDILRNLDAKYSKIAANLGANHFQVFKNVLLPLILPTVASGFIILFTFSFGAFEIPHLLGPSSPSTLPIMSYIYYNSVNLADRPYAMVINMFIALFSFITVGVYIIMFRFIKKFSA
jgi:putative spermidine/putrescine transport system permease protein